MASLTVVIASLAVAVARVLEVSYGAIDHNYDRE
jgi:hypothetical protein